MSVSNLLSKNSLDLMSQTITCNVVSSDAIKVSAITNSTGAVIGNPSIEFKDGEPYMEWGETVLRFGKNGASAGCQFSMSEEGERCDISLVGSFKTSQEGVVGLSEVAGATLADASTPINTSAERKFKGALVYNGSDNDVYVAIGSSSTSSWKSLVSGSLITPS